MKKFLLGFIIAALLFSAIPIQAAIEEYVLYKADYRLVINGEEYSDEELPILNYKGYTYAPVRSVFEAAGLNVEWTGGMAVVTLPEPEPEPEKEEPPVTEPAEPTEQTLDEPTKPKDETDKKDSAKPSETNSTESAETQTETRTTTQTEQTTGETTQEIDEEPEPNMAEYESELAALKAAYEADIKAIDDWLSNYINNLINYYDQMIRMYPTEQQQKRIVGEREAKIEEAYISAKNQKDNRTAQYNADVEALKARYGL